MKIVVVLALAFGALACGGKKSQPTTTSNSSMIQGAGGNTYGGKTYGGNAYGGSKYGGRK